MSNILHTAIRILSGKTITALVIAISIAGRFIQLVFFYSIRFDASYQVIATQNLVNGHGISIPKVFAADLATTIHEPLVNWPPGYSVLLAPFYLLFNHNYIAAGLTLDILAAIVLIITSRAILKLFHVPLYQVNLFTLISGFFIYYFYFIASSDAIAISLFLLAVYYFFKLIKSGNVDRSAFIVGTTALLAAAATKYLFIPVVIVLPLFIFFYGWKNKNSSFKKAGITSFLILFVGIGLLLTWQKLNSGTAAYISEPGRGFFPEHLLAAYPFFPASFLKPDTVALLTGQRWETGTLVYRILQFIHLLLFILFIIFVSKHWIKKRKLAPTPAESFILLTLIISIIITILLSTLSLFVPQEEIVKGYFWTYIEEARYYGLANVLLQLSVFVALQLKSFAGNRICRFALYTLLVLMVFEMGRGMLFDAKRIRNFGKEEYSWQYEYRFQQFADKILKGMLKDKDAGQVIVTGSSHYMNNRVSLYNNIPVWTENHLLNNLDAVLTSGPVTLLVIIHESEFVNFRSFLAGKKPSGSFEGYYFYITDVRQRN